MSSLYKKYGININRLLLARERMGQKGMVLSHDKKTDKLVAFRLRY